MRYIINVIAILVVAAIVSLAVYFKNNSTIYPFQGDVHKFLKEVSQFMTATKRNINMSIAPTRRKKITFIDKESILRQYIPWVFGEFTDGDWKNFWGLIYNPISDPKSKYGQKRYRAKEEIEGYLIENYSNPFSYFNKSQWQDFWNIVGADIQ